MKPMTRMLKIAAVLLFTSLPVVRGVAHAAGPSSPEAAAVEAQLVVPDREVLPGVPFEMWIELRNASEKTVGVGACADMLVSPEGGAPFTIAFGGEERPPYPTLLPADAWNSAAVTYVTLKPRQTQTLTLPFLPELSGPLYFADHRLSKPGRYAVSFRLGYCWPPFTAPQAALLPRDYAGAVATNSVVVERIAPTGTDAIVWNRMQELTGGKWVSIGWLSGWNAGGRGRGESAGRVIVNEILSKYPDSNYYPYALLASSFGAVRGADLVRLTNAIERFPRSPVVDMLHEEVLALTNAGCGLKGHAMAGPCGRAKAALKASKRPTTRLRAFGREDVAAPPCGAEEDCID